jgi:hypothetical protein
MRRGTPLLAEPLPVQRLLDVEAGIVEHITIQFAIFYFCTFHKSAYVHQVFEAELLAGVKRIQERFSVCLRGVNGIRDEGTFHNNSNGGNGDLTREISRRGSYSRGCYFTDHI